MSLFQQAPKSLCILRLSAIGDVCNALAAVQRIQEYWPTTEITWIIGKTEYQIVKHLSWINWVVFDKKSGLKGILATWKSLRHQQFDALLNMQSAMRATVLSLGIKAKYKIGYNREYSREGQYYFTNQHIDKAQGWHVTDSFMMFCEKLGIPTAAPKWNLPLPQEARLYSAQFIDKTCKNLLISPCASSASRDWLTERYIEVANFAHAKGVNVIICGSNSPRELAVATKIANACPFVVNTAGKTSLIELCALISQVDLLLSPDSGPAHIATTQHTPVIGLYVRQNPKRTGPYNDVDSVVSAYEELIKEQYGDRPVESLPWVTKTKGDHLMVRIETATVIEKLAARLGL